MRNAAPVWVCMGLFLCALFLAATAAAAPHRPAHLAHFEGGSSAISRRWLYNPRSGQWKPVGESIRVRQRPAVRGRAEVAYEFPLCDLHSRQFNPVVALHSEHDEFLVVWEDARNGVDLDVYGQRFTGDGRLLGDNVALVIGQYDQSAPVLFYDAVEDGYLLLWHHREPGNGVIRGQRLSTAGIPLGEPFRVPAPNEGQQWVPGGAHNDMANEFLVVWEDMVMGDIIGQRITSAGVPIGDPIVISTWVDSQLAPPFVAFSSVQQEYLVIWDALALGDMYAQIIGADGMLRGRNLPISTAVGEQFASDVVYSNSSDEYLVLWTDERALRERGSDVYGQRIAANGTLVGGEFVVSGAAEWQRDCVAAYDPTHGEYFLVWVDGRGADTASDIYGQRVSANGVLLGTNVSLSAAIGSQVSPRLARRQAGDQYAIVWQVWRDGDKEENGADIYGLLYSPQRFCLWFPRFIHQTPRSAFSSKALAP